MPLVKIDMIKGVRTPEEIKKFADVVQEIMLDKFAAPARDRYQVCTIYSNYAPNLLHFYSVHNVEDRSQDEIGAFIFKGYITTPSAPSSSLYPSFCLIQSCSLRRNG